MSSTCDYTFDSVVRIVIVTVVITLLIIGFFISVIWLYLCKRNADKFDISYDPNATQLSIIKSNQFNHNQSRFAFDNPYFKDDENDFTETNNDKLRSFNYNNQSSDATILSNGALLQDEFDQTGQNPIVNYVLNRNKNKVTSTKPLINARKAWEDGDVYKPETISVDLIGHDFTGLGFNISGNMRDGIFIKDVLNRGPANESKKIKPGDKLSSLTISMNNMVYEDALTILSYASPYKVTLTLERDEKTNNKERKSKKSNLKTQRTLNNNCNQKIMVHPLYKTRSVDNLIQIGKYDNSNHLNYGSTHNYRDNYRTNQEEECETSRNSYSQMINKFKKQIFFYLNPSASQNNYSNYSNNTSGENETIEKRGNIMRPIQNLFKPNKPNWSTDFSNNSDNNLNAIVVGNNLAFKDDDEDEEFRRQFQLSQLKYQQQSQNPIINHNVNYNLNHHEFNAQYDLPDHINQPHSLQHQQTDASYNRTTSYNSHQQTSQQPTTNLLKYHQTMNDLSKVDHIQHQSANQFVNINLNDLTNQQNKLRPGEMDYNTRKGNTSAPLNDHLNDISLTPSSQSFTSVPLTTDDLVNSSEIDRQNQLPPTTIAEIHAVANQSIDQSLDQSINYSKENSSILNSEDCESTNMNDKPRSSSMNDLPNRSIVSMNPEALKNDLRNTTNYRSNLERAISLDLSNQNTANHATMMGLKLSKSVFTNKILKSKMKNQPAFKQHSLGDLNYEQQKKNFLMSNEKLSHSNMANSLQATSLSTSNGKLNNQSKSIRNSLSTNSTCSSPSLPSDTNTPDKIEYEDASMLMLKSSLEENNSILMRPNIGINNTKSTSEFNNQKSLYDNFIPEHHQIQLDDDELEAKESILFVNDQHTVKAAQTVNSMIDEKSDQSFDNDRQFLKVEEQVKKIVNDVFGMSSIRTLNSIKSDKQLDDLFQLNRQIDSPVDDNQKNFNKSSSTSSNISNFKISSKKKESPFFSSNVSSIRDNILAKDRTARFSNESKDQSLNKENKNYESKPPDRLVSQESSQSNKLEDEICQIKNRVSRLKKEFSLRQKEIQNQNMQNNLNKYRKMSDSQSNSKPILSVKEKNIKVNKSLDSSIGKKQEQLINNSKIDFEPWTFKEN